MIEAIERLFKRLSATYGERWDASVGNAPLDDVKTVWAHELDVFRWSLYRIAWALENLPERCPNVIEFRNLCRTAPAAEVLKLPEPPADPERVRAELAKLEPVKAAALSKQPVDHKAWCDRILARVAAGAKVSPTVVQMAQQARRPPPDLFELG